MEDPRKRAAKPADGEFLPGGGASFVQGFDQSVLDLQKAVGNRAVLRMLNDEANVAGPEGYPLDPAVRAFMESRLDTDLGDVRIHTGADASRKATLLDSAAFTLGRDIYFSTGRFAPHTPEGTHLLAHELSHVVQQRRGGPGAPRAGSNASEAAAGASAGQVSRRGIGAGVSGSSAPGIARQKNPASPAPRAQLYEYTFAGKTIRLTEDQYKAEIARTIHNLGIEFNRVEGTAQFHRETHQDFLDHTHNFFGVVSDILADTVPPNIGIWSWPKPAIANGREALNAGRVESAGRQLKIAQSALRDAQHEWNSYMEKTIGGAQQAVTYLETTRDISFAVAIGTAAIVAAPVVAAGAAAAGLTGATATVATGAVITAGGGVAGAGLRGGSAAAGQELAFGRVNLSEVKKEAAEGFKHGAVDASTALVTAGTGKLLGEGASVGGRILRHAVAGGVGGGFSGGAGAALEGKSAKEIAAATGTGFASGLVGGGVTSAIGGSAAQQSLGRRVLAGSAGSLASGTTAAVLSGGSREDVKRAVVTSLITGVATSGAAPSHGAPAPEGTPQPRRIVPHPSEETSPRPSPAEKAARPTAKAEAPVAEPVSLDEFRQKKLAAAPQETPEVKKAVPPEAEREATVHSLDEARQKRAAAAARKTPPAPEAETQAVSQQQEEIEHAQMAMAAGAEGQTPQTAEAPTTGERRLKIVASAGKGGGRPGGDLRGVTEFRNREFGRRRPSLSDIQGGPRTLSEHVEELGEAAKSREQQRGKKGKLFSGESVIHTEAGKAIEPVEVEIFGGDLISKGASAVYANHEFPDWLRKAFPKSATSPTSKIREGPDLVAIDPQKKTVIVGDVTAKPNKQHLFDTIADAQKVAAALQDEYKDFAVVAQERYYGTDEEYSREFVVKERSGK